MSSRPDRSIRQSSSIGKAIAETISVSNCQKRKKKSAKLPLSLILTACLIILKGLHYFKNVILFYVAFYVMLANSLLELCDSIHIIYILFS